MSKENAIFDDIEGLMIEDARKIYSQTVLDHFNNPRNLGEMKDADSFNAMSGICGDTIAIYVGIENGAVSRISFLTNGCGPTIACQGAEDRGRDEDYRRGRHRVPGRFAGREHALCGPRCQYSAEHPFQGIVNRMTVWRRLIDILGPTCADAVIDDVRIGLGYTAIRLDDGRTGVAYTMGKQNLKGCSAFVGKRPLAGRPAPDLVQYLGSGNLVESSLGLATANAAAGIPASLSLKGDVLDAVEVRATDRVAMVGFFGPLVAGLKGRVTALDIFEERTDLAEDLKPASSAIQALRDADIAIITSTAIINRTVDDLLEAAARCREVILLGPSTPLVPEAFEGTPVSVLSGVTVHDSPGLLRVISEGGGTRLFGPFVTKWNIQVRSGA